MRLLRARRRDARLQDLQPQRFVERADLDAEADAQARAHALVERFQVVRRAVGGDDHLAARVEQSIERVTEFSLDVFPLKELRVVKNEQVDRSQPLLEGDRRLGLQRGDEAVHEFLGGQIDDRAPLLGRGMRDRLQEMGLTEADGRMDVERAKGGRPAPVGVSHALHCVKGELIGPPNLESGEGQPPIERRSGQGVADRARRGRSAGRSALGGNVIDGQLERLGRHLRGRGALGRGTFGHRRERSRGAHGNQDLPDRADFGVQRRSDMSGVVGNDPTLEKARRNRKSSLPRSDRLQREAPKPAVEDSVADFRPQSIAATSPCFAKQRPPRTAVVKAIGVGFVIHVHGLPQARGGQPAMRRCQGTGHERCSLRLRPGQPACLPPADPASSTRTVQRTFEPIRHIETWPPTRARHRDCGVARPRPRTAQEHERRAALDARRLQQRLKARGKVGVNRHRRIALPFQEQWSLGERLEVRRPYVTPLRLGPDVDKNRRRCRLRAAHRRRLREDLQRIQRSSDRTLPLPPQPTLRIYIEFNLFLKTGQQKILALISRRGWMRPPLYSALYPERLFLLSTYACLTNARQAQPQFLSFLDVVKIMARVSRWRNLLSAAKKRCKSGESGQLLNNSIMFLCKGLI